MILVPAPAVEGLEMNGRDQLRNDIRKDLCVHMKLGWLNEVQAQTLGASFLEALAELLWEITDQWPALSERSCKPDEWWESYANRRKKGHKKQRLMDLALLETKLCRLLDMTLQTWWSAAPTWSGQWASFCPKVPPPPCTLIAHITFLS